MKSQSATSNGGLFIAGTWLAVTLALKVLGILNVSWWIITLPFWLGALVAVFAIVLLAIIFGFENENHGA